MSEPEQRPHSASEPALPDWAPVSGCLGIRVWAVNGNSQQELVERVGVILGEHMTETDELHVSYNAMQSGHQHHAGYRGLKAAQPWT